MLNIFKYVFNRKYRVFRKKIRDVQVSIWEYDFKVAKARYLREAVRQERDRAVEAKNNIEKAIAVEQNEEKKKGLETELAHMTELVGKYEAQMKMIDDQIDGVPASGENPGQQGILETIQGLAELREMYKDYVKHGM